MITEYTEKDLISAGMSYFNDTLASDVWAKKYALKNNGKWEEGHPTETLNRIINEFSRMENKYPNPLPKEKIEEHLQHFKHFIPAGSILFGLGNSYQISSLGNCFFIDNGTDSYGGIFNTDESMVQLMKRRGGVGITLENLRPAHSKVNNAAQSSTGAVSFMDRFSNSTREVAQDGRRGALMISMHCAHPNIKDFIFKKDDLTKVTGANVSVKITDQFMKAVEYDQDYILRWPVTNNQPKITEQIAYNKLYKREDGSYIMKVRAKEIWEMIIKQAHKNAEPGVLFWDNIINESPADCYKDVGFETLGTNPCVSEDTLILTEKGEIPIIDILNKETIIWNGNQWSKVIPAETGKTKLWYILQFDNGKTLKCTEYHKFYIGKDQLEKQAKDLNEGDEIYAVDKNFNTYITKLTNIKLNILSTHEKTYCFTEPINHKGVFNGLLTGQCGEVPLSSHDSCRLGSINLSNMVSKPYLNNAKVDWNLLAEVARVAQRLMDDVVSLEEEKVLDIIQKIESDPESYEIKRTEHNLWLKVLDVLRKGRRTGVGVLGLGDMLAKLNIRYGSKEATELINKVFQTIAVNSYRESVQLAKERGCFPIWDADKEAQNPFIIRVISNHFSTQEYNDYLQYGRRNIANLSIAPTGSLAILAKTTSGIEPVFKIYYKRRRKINPNEPNAKVDFKDDNGDSWQEYNVFHTEFINWAETMGYVNLELMPDKDVDEIVAKSPWAGSESHSIDYIEKVNMQGIIQKWVDHSISVTHNLPEHISLDEVNKIYFQAWKAGCKGCTIYREGSRTGVLITNKTSDKKEEEFKQSNAPKRPKELKADYYVATAEGVKYAVIVGVWKDTNKPYEIFAFENPPLDKNTKGRIVKIRKGHYKFINGEFEIENLQLAANRIEQRAHTILLSMLLRHGAPIEHIVEVAKKVDENIISFSSVCRRVLSKYIPSEELNEKCPNTDCGGHLIREEGCVHCDSCSYSRC